VSLLQADQRAEKVKERVEDWVKSKVLGGRKYTGLLSSLDGGSRKKNNGGRGLVEVSVLRKARAVKSE